jgi:hypothetical protein
LLPINLLIFNRVSTWDFSKSLRQISSTYKFLNSSKTSNSSITSLTLFIKFFR